jgi:hypothetical protein
MHQQLATGENPTVQQEIIDLLQDRRFHTVEILEIYPRARELPAAMGAADQLD